MDRRNFIKLTAVTGGAVTLASCGNPEHELIRFVPDEDLTPGLAEIKNGVCPQCSAGCGTTIRVMQGDVDTVRGGQAGVVTMSLAKKLEGNPTHPVNQGTLCPRGQAAIQIAYHPDRINAAAQAPRRPGQQRFPADHVGRRYCGTGRAARRARRVQGAVGARVLDAAQARARAGT